MHGAERWPLNEDCVGFGRGLPDFKEERIEGGLAWKGDWFNRPGGLV